MDGEMADNWVEKCAREERGVQLGRAVDKWPSRT